MVKKVQNKGGRPPDFETPDDLLAAWEAYKKHVKSDPYIVIDYRGNPPEKVELTKEKPLIEVGFIVFLGKEYENKYLDHFKNSKTVEADERFLHIITRIREEIRTDQVGGGMAGVYNSNLTARLNGLVDKKEMNTPDIAKVISLFPTMEEIQSNDPTRK